MALLLKDDREGRQKLAGRLYRDFHAMKTYGKEPESLESIISLFNETMAEYPIEKVLEAMHSHAKASPEFPTPAEVIKRIEDIEYEKNRKQYSFEDDTPTSPPCIETLKRYCSMGIALSSKQQLILEDYQKTIVARYAA